MEQNMAKALQWDKMVPKLHLLTPSLCSFGGANL